jgi:hypothetical protein
MSKVGFLLIILFWVLGAWMASFFLPYVFSEFESAGQFGDMFGSVNALFSGLGTVGLIATILLQIEANKESERNRLFDTLLKLISDLKIDLSRFGFLGSHGYQAFHLMRDYLRYGVTVSAEKFKYPIVILGMITNLTKKIRESSLSQADKQILYELLQLTYANNLLNLIEEIKRLPNQGFVVNLREIIDEMEIEFRKADWPL